MLLPLLAAALLALTALPTRAAPAGGGDYLALQVPDLPRAVQFFHAVMNCAPIDAGADASQTALLDCGDGHIVALTRGEAPNGHQAAAGTLTTDDALAAAAWLRANHVRILGRPVRVAEGPGVEQVVVTFLTPWGQPLQLASHSPASALPVDARLAVQ